MALIAGNWTLTAIANEAGWQQRVVISGSNGQDGAHPMVIGTTIANVQGDRVTVTPQAYDPGSNTWLDSLVEEKMSWDDVDGVVITIYADDNPSAGDHDFNDLVVRCTTNDDALKSPTQGFPRLDLTIPDNYWRQKPRRETHPGARRRKSVR